MKKIHYALYREEAEWVAQCLNVDVSSFGATQEEALVNLKESVKLYLEAETQILDLPEIEEVTVGEMAIA